MTREEMIERIIKRYGLCRPEDNHPHGDYTFDHGHTDCWLLGQVIQQLRADQRWRIEANIVQDSWDYCFDALPVDVQDKALGKRKSVAVLHHLLRQAPQ